MGKHWTLFVYFLGLFLIGAIPDYLVSRFQSKTHLLRIIAATTLSVFVIIYVSAQIDTTGKAFETFVSWYYNAGIGVGFAIVLLYTFPGGFVAVAWSDLFQALLTLIGLVAFPMTVYWMMSKEGRLTAGLEVIDSALLNIWEEGGLSLKESTLNSSQNCSRHSCFIFWPD